MSESEIFVWSKKTDVNLTRIETHRGDLDNLYQTFAKEALPDDVKAGSLVDKKRRYEAIVVAEKNQRAVGALLMNRWGKDHWELAASAVKPEARREGTWRKLIVAAENYAVSHGAKTIEATPGGPFRKKLSQALQDKGYLPVGGDDSVLRKII